ncbi:4'-phosphopantetheinyl transferase family protein [Aestuariivirga sp.]|uniref:4'-phosphopantetheinyl transferase family protein n=1 Tax=Aestuariivirga sp. TaxID=2650926 RepID=UPI0039E5EBD4
MKGKKNVSELIDRLRHSFTLLQVPLPQVRIAAATDDGTMDPGALLTLLTDEERASAEARNDESERRHLVFRRAFQRAFVGDLIGWTGTLPDLTLRHATDTPPNCDQAPGLTLSFSSSGTTCLAAAAPDALLGIDIEARRDIADASGIAARFFTPAEADLVTETPPDHRSEAFQTIWCAKEAGLKAKGRGIVSGLNAFTIERDETEWTARDSEDAGSRPWQLWYPSGLPRHIVAVMHRSRANSRPR